MVSDGMDDHKAAILLYVADTKVHLPNGINLDRLKVLLQKSCMTVLS